jgi:hypothetical protein
MPALVTCTRLQEQVLTFAWSARALPIRRLAAAQGWSDAETDALDRFRDDLVARVIADSQPGGSA